VRRIAIVLALATAGPATASAQEPPNAASGGGEMVATAAPTTSPNTASGGGVAQAPAAPAPRQIAPRTVSRTRLAIPAAPAVGRAPVVARPAARVVPRPAPRRHRVRAAPHRHRPVAVTAASERSVLPKLPEVATVRVSSVTAVPLAREDGGAGPTPYLAAVALALMLGATARELREGVLD
jgi:hypothetical protein